MTEPPSPSDQPDTEARGPSGDEKVTLSRELGEFLLELSIGAHRYAMYPPDHPSLRPAAENAIGRLGALLQERETLSIGVARNQLVIEGVGTDPKHPVLSDLARRLHDHQLAAVSFTRGVTLTEVEGLLKTLASDSGDGADPLGLRPRSEIPTWEHVKILPVGYEKLALGGSGDQEGPQGEKVTRLWLGLARAALATDDPVDGEAPPEAGMVAESIAGRDRDAAYDQVIVGYLLQLAEELKTAEGEEADAVRKRMSGLIEDLDHDTLERLVEMGGSFSQRRKFVLDANEGLAVEAVMKIVTAAAKASEQTISGSLTRLLSKLAVHADRGPDRMRSRADTALRENVEELIDHWELEDPNPDQYNLVLDAMSKSNPLFETEREDGSGEDGDREPQETGAGRLLVMALEVDALGPMVEKAVSDLLEEDELGWVLRQLDAASEGNRVAEHFRTKLTAPERLTRLLSGQDVDEETLDSLVRRIGPEAVEPLVSAISESESRAIRRKVFDCLAELDPERFPVTDRAMELLEDPRWYVKRNMLGLLQELEPLPDSFSALRYLRHPDARVRREAFPVAVGIPRERDEAVQRALLDPDERLVRMALLEAQEGVTDQAARIVYERLIEEEEMPELRFLAVRVLRGSDAPAALEGLVEVSLGGRTILGRRKLAEKSSELLVALAGLAERWSESPEAREVLKLARRSGDEEIRAAADGEGAS